MAKQLQLRKGTATEHDTFTGANGEVTVDTTNKTLRVHDGVTVGGTMLAASTGGSIPASQLPAATTSTQGIVKLNNTLTSTSTTEALTAAQGKVLKDTLDTAVSSSLGVGQTWQNVTGSRQLGVSYTNNTGKPIFASIDVLGSSSGYDGIRIVVGGTVVSELLNIAENQYSQIAFIIPAEQSYSAQQTQATINLRRWSELR